MEERKFTLKEIENEFDILLAVLKIATIKAGLDFKEQMTEEQKEKISAMLLESGEMLKKELIAGLKIKGKMDKIFD